MAINPPSAYGRDLACFYDADEIFSDDVGIAIVKQDTFHRLTTDDVLGDDGTGTFVIAGWGFDVTRLLGLPATELPGKQLVISEVLQRDLRILTADVTLTATRQNGLDDVLVEVHCMTAEGPFSIVLSVLELVTLQGAA